MKHAFAALLLGAGLVLPGWPAAAQMDSREAIALNNQIAELRYQLQMMREQMGRGGGGGGNGSALGGYRGAPGPAPAVSGDLATQLLDRVTALEEEVRRLRGRVDEADNARQRMGEDLSKQIADLNFKVDGMASGAGAGAASAAAGSSGAAPAPTSAPAPAAPPPAAPARATPEQLLQQGNAALARRDYAAAENAAREVLSGPRTPRSLDANFLLAQALAGKRDWAKAAVAYDDTYNRAQTGARAQDSLLGLSGALIALNEKKAACETLSKLHAEFPKPRADLREPIASARQRAGCR